MLALSRSVRLALQPLQPAHSLLFPPFYLPQLPPTPPPSLPPPVIHSSLFSGYLPSAFSGVVTKLQDGASRGRAIEEIDGRPAAQVIFTILLLILYHPSAPKITTMLSLLQQIKINLS